MNLYKQSFRWYHVVIDADAPVTLLEASFDDGATWFPGEQTDVGWRWRIAGSEATDLPAGVHVITEDQRPLLRATGDGVRLVEPSGVAINIKE